MNFVLSTLILVIILTPGALVIQSYYTSVKEKQSSIHIPFNDLLLRGIIFTLFIHSCGLCILRICGKRVDFSLFYKLIAGNDIDFDKIDFTKSFLQFICYTFFCCLFASVITKLFKYLARQNNWDIDFFSLRNTNYWFHVFGGRYLESENVQGSQAVTDLIILDVLTEKNVIYSGILIDFNYSPQKDELENIILDTVVKRNYNKDANDERENHSTGKPSRIPGDVFVIPASKIVNLNIHYIRVNLNDGDVKERIYHVPFSPLIPPRLP